jgi:hypothetical protein
VQLSVWGRRQILRYDYAADSDWVRRELTHDSPLLSDRLNHRLQVREKIMRTEKLPTVGTGTTRRRPRVALRLAAAAAIIALPLSVAVVAGQASANTTPASTVELNQSVAVGFVGAGATKTFTVDVPTSGHWKLDFGVSYPSTAGRIRSAVDGHALPEVVSRVDKGSFMTNAYTPCFALTKGKHNITVTAAQLPGTTPLMVTLVDAATPAS